MIITLTSVNHNSQHPHQKMKHQHQRLKHRPRLACLNFQSLCMRTLNADKDMKSINSSSQQEAVWRSMRGHHELITDNIPHPTSTVPLITLFDSYQCRGCNPVSSLQYLLMTLSLLCLIREGPPIFCLSPTNGVPRTYHTVEKHKNLHK